LKEPGFNGCGKRLMCDIIGFEPLIPISQPSDGA